MMSSAPLTELSGTCPAPVCIGAGRAAGLACECDRRLPTAVCGACGAVNRLGGTFCRACGKGLVVGHPPDLQPGPATLLGIPGSFRKAPLLVDDVFYAIDTEGRVSSLSGRAGAKAEQIARLQFAAAAFNVATIVNVVNPTGPRGLTLLALSPDGIEAVRLADASVQVLHRATAGAPLAANGSEQDATGFRGLAANRSLCAFGVQVSTQKVALMLRYFSKDRAPEQPLVLNGRQSIGPVLCGTAVVLCTEEEVGVFDLVTQRAVMCPLPLTFRPLLRRADGLNILPGSMPVTVTADNEAWIAGESGGRQGVLKIDAQTGKSTFARAENSCVCSLSDGSMLIASPGGLEHSDGSLPGGLGVTLQPRMPAALAGAGVALFCEQDGAVWHHVRLTRGGGSADLWLEQEDCNLDSCCGLYVLERDLLVAWLDVSSNATREGLRFAHWSLSR